MDLQSIFYALGIAFILMWLVILLVVLILVMFIFVKLKSASHKVELWSAKVDDFTDKLQSKSVGFIAVLAPLVIPVITAIVSRMNKKN